MSWIRLAALAVAAAGILAGCCAGGKCLRGLSEEELMRLRAEERGEYDLGYLLKQGRKMRESVHGARRAAGEAHEFLYDVVAAPGDRAEIDAIRRGVRSGYYRERELSGPRVGEAHRMARNLALARRLDEWVEEEAPWLIMDIDGALASLEDGGSDGGGSTPQEKADVEELRRLSQEMDMILDEIPDELRALSLYSRALHDLVGSHQVPEFGELTGEEAFEFTE